MTKSEVFAQVNEAYKALSELVVKLYQHAPHEDFAHGLHDVKSGILWIKSGVELSDLSKFGEPVEPPQVLDGSVNEEQDLSLPVMDCATDAVKEA